MTIQLSETEKAVIVRKIMEFQQIIALLAEFKGLTNWSFDQSTLTFTIPETADNK